MCNQEKIKQLPVSPLISSFCKNNQYMKQESVEGIQPEQVPTRDKKIRVVEHKGHPVMNEQFMNIYKSALGYSNMSLKQQLKIRNVLIYGQEYMHEIYTWGDEKLPHLVTLHGYGGTALTYIRMFQHLKCQFQVHALDTFGCGLSSRGKWHDKMKKEQVMEYFVEPIEQWRKTIGIQQFVLAGHSFGGYIGCLYYQKYPQKVKHIYFLSPAGTARLTEQQIQGRKQKSSCFTCIAETIYNFNIRPSSTINNCIFGNCFLNKVVEGRLKLSQNQQLLWKEYIRMIARQASSSQKGFYDLFQWPLQPSKSIQMMIKQMKPEIKIDFMYGDEDWMQPDGARRLAREFKNIKVHTVQDAGHQLLFDNPSQVSSIIKQSWKNNPEKQ